MTSELNERHLNEMNELRTETEERLAALARQREETVSEMRETHGAEVAEMARKYTEEMAALREKTGSVSYRGVSWWE